MKKILKIIGITAILLCVTGMGCLTKSKIKEGPTPTPQPAKEQPTPTQITPPMEQTSKAIEQVKLGEVFLTWPKADPKQVYGFNVYRGDKAEGPFKKLNPDVIMADAFDPKTGYFMFIDGTAILHNTYFYYVEKILTTGDKVRMIEPTEQKVNRPVSK